MFVSGFVPALQRPALQDQGNCTVPAPSTAAVHVSKQGTCMVKLPCYCCCRSTNTACGLGATDQAIVPARGTALQQRNAAQLKVDATPEHAPNRPAAAAVLVSSTSLAAPASWGHAAADQRTAVMPSLITESCDETQ
jgi:hypothetical protein